MKPTMDATGKMTPNQLLEAQLAHHRERLGFAEEALTKAQASVLSNHQWVLEARRKVQEFEAAIPQCSLEEPSLMEKLIIAGVITQEGMESDCTRINELYEAGLAEKAARPGTAIVREAPDASRLIPFGESMEGNYLLEFGDHSVRIICDGEPVMVEDIPVVLATPYAVADLPLLTCESLSYLQLPDAMVLVHPGHPAQKITRVSRACWTFEPYLAEKEPHQH